MSAIVGLVSFEKDILTQQDTLNKMLLTQKHRGGEGEEIWINKYCGIASTISSKCDNLMDTPFSKNYDEKKFVIVCDGTIYNKKELKYELELKGYKFTTNCQEELILSAYMQWGEDMPMHLDGMFAFAIWSDSDESIFIVRDRFGIKPLYFSKIDDTLVFGSEQKVILAHPKINAVIDNNSIAEIFAMGPMHTPGLSVFKDVFEVKPSHYIKFNKTGMNIRRYWEFEPCEHTDTLQDTIEKVQFLVQNSVTHQGVGDVSAMLSGGLDSSIIAAITAKNMAFNNNSKLDTFSLEYKDNDKFFNKSAFQPDSDKEFINIMNNKFNTKHKNIVVDTETLVSLLKDAVIARDLPAMADIDTSLLHFCKQIAKSHKIALSGECADELFGGYPWFYNSDNVNTFPWLRNLEDRIKVLSKDMIFYCDPINYSAKRYDEAVDKAPKLQGESIQNAKHRELFYINLMWFGRQLLDRTDRISGYSGLEVRCPFIDHKIAQYAYNIPFDMKALGGREKGLLRCSFADLLPEEIVKRKKSPFPKTHNPGYEKKVKDILTQILEDSSSPILQIVDKSYVLDTMKQDSDVSKPFFGQLMANPQFYAYLIQTDIWLKEYKISIK